MSKKKLKKPAQMAPKNPKFSENALRGSGYKYKLLHLTDDEKDEYEKGRKVIDKHGKEVRRESTDFDYWFKEIESVVVKIFKVGDEFYYNGARITSTAQLPLVEKDAVSQKQYAEFASQLKDTVPAVSLDVPHNTGEGPKKNLDELLPNEILLKGGKFDGQAYVWDNRLPVFPLQYADKNGRTKLSRYARDRKSEKDLNTDKRIYYSLDTM
jgi:hypothetical protein